jgi:peptidylprolyl isomerase
MKQVIFVLLVLLAIVGLFLLWGGDNEKNIRSASESASLGDMQENNFEEGEMSELENTFYMDISTGGRVVIKAFPAKAPNHVARFKELVREGYYDGVVFHRVIEGFMAQTGDPTGTGSGGSGQNIDAEFNDIHHGRGIVSTARSMDVNSADSQFFIMLADHSSLDGEYTAWGEVVEGMEFIDDITKGPRENNGVVPEDERDSIISMSMAIDEEVAQEADDEAEAEAEAEAEEVVAEK